MIDSGIRTKAAVLTELKKPLSIIDDIKVPAPAKGQLLVKVLYAGLCHSQLMEINGGRGDDPYLPHFLGHEGVAEVIQVGDGVTKVAVGDQVVLGWIKGEGLDGGPCAYESADGQTINAGAIAAFTQYAIVSENRVVPKPENTPEMLSVLYGCAVPTGFGMVINSLPEKASGSIAFLGLGGIGLSALMAAKLYDFEHIIAIDINPDKLDLALSLGATEVINPIERDLQSAVLSMTQGEGLDYCFESAGQTKTIEQAFDLVKRGGGKCIFASHPPAGQKIEIDPFELICGKEIVGTWGGSVKPDCDVVKFDKLYEQGVLPLDKMVSGTYELENINAAIDDLKDQKIARAVIMCA